MVIHFFGNTYVYILNEKTTITAHKLSNFIFVV